jgi:ATP-dependent Clp protease ATP-binding subunit ClpC
MSLSRGRRRLAPMFERLTQPARRAVVRAQEEARLLDHDYIGTEHILLGLLHGGGGLAAQAFDSLGVTLERARLEVEQIIGRGSSVSGGDLSFTERAKAVLGVSLRDALQLGQNYIGTEHLLLALLHVEDGLAPMVLARLAGKPATVRAKLLELLETEGPTSRPTSSALCGAGNCTFVPQTRPPSHATCPRPRP